ncbi:ATP-dependent zinc metalloprotease FtsH [Agrobacterium rubi]|nr:ATP-dependent zinc metalloprotease FtsH [Agrobacterium rubi]NTF23767.1 ATP-dependent zinc metalloprotease FtsH [Agrobacterium rubi]
MQIFNSIKQRASKLLKRFNTFRRERPDALAARICGGIALTILISFCTWFLLQPQTISLTKLIEEIDAKRIVSAEIMTQSPGYRVVVVIDDEEYQAKVPGGPLTGTNDNGMGIVQLLKSNGVEVEFVNGVVQWMQIIAAVTMPLLFFFMIGFMVWHQFMDGMSAWMNVVRNVTTRFEHVAGAEEAKLEMQEVLSFMKADKSAFEKTRARTPRGVLLSGPPGNGKTLLAKAMAGEAGMSFIAVSGSDFQSSFYGGSQRRVRSLFSFARRVAPCIIFIDEIDAIAAKRAEASDVFSKESNGTLNQLLVQMDGFNRNDDIIVIGATNLVDHLDPAIKRPGRMDRHIEIGLPDQKGRTEILKVHATRRELDEDVSFETVARGTPGFSGADLENLINEAAIFAVRENRSSIAARDLEAAKNKVIMGLERKTIRMSDQERELTAVHEAGHALAACLSPLCDPVHRATIVPHGRALGMVVSLPERDRFSMPLAKLRDDLVMAMAGRAAEAVVFGEDMITSGAEADIDHATRYATAMVTRWGFSKTIGMVRITDAQATNDQAVKDEIRLVVAKAYQDALTLVEGNRDRLQAIADALLDKESLTGDEVRRLAVAPANTNVQVAA